MLIYSENVNCSIYNTILKIYFLILQFNMTFIYEYENEMIYYYI